MHSDQQRAAWRTYNRRRRASAKKFGICSTCLSRSAERGRAACRVCRQKRSTR
jgi:hypothetical protein